MTESGMPDMSALVEQARQMQERLLVAKDELASQVVEGSTAGGLVTARVKGTGELVGLDISPEAVDPNDTETLADMVVAAIRDANHNAETLAAERLGDVTGGLGGLGGGLTGGGLPGLPGSPGAPGGPPAPGPIGF